MKKNFFTICFSLIMFAATVSRADIIPLTQSGSSRPIPPAQSENELELPDPNNQDEVRSYFKKRLENATFSVKEKDADLSNSGSVDVVHSEEYYKAMEEENKKGMFQKFYEKALASLGGKDTKAESSYYNEERESERIKAIAAAAQKYYFFKDDEPQAKEPQIPTVGVVLPSGRRILAPAREHIAYFLSYVDVHANGYLKIEDTITFVANNDKFAYGLVRQFPKYAAKHQQIEFMLESVTVNGTKVPYMVEAIGDNIMVKPKYNQRLAPGVYTYVFTYTINNKLTSADKQQFLDWNLIGTLDNIVLTSANAIITIPSGYEFSDIIALVGRPELMTQRRTNRFDLARNVVAFSNITPMIKGESMHLLAVMDNAMFLKDFNRNFSHFLINWGNIFYAGLGLFAILISFVLSLLNLRRERKNKKYTPSYNGSLMRSIIVSKYDRVAFVAQILDLFRKNALDIKQSDNRIYLQKKDTNSAKLSSPERRALKTLFYKQGNAIEVNTSNNVRFKKAKKILEKIVTRQIKKYNIFHNIGYVLFGTAMLLLTEIFIAFISVNFAQTLIILLSTTLMYAFYIWILRHRFKRWYVAIPTKIIILLAMFVIWIFSSIYIGGICSLLIMIMVAVIFAFNGLFGIHNSFANEAKEAIIRYKEYLISNAEAINLSRDFVNQQSNVFALDICEYFPQNVSNKNYHRLEEADVLKQRLIDII